MKILNVLFCCVLLCSIGGFAQTGNSYRASKSSLEFYGKLPLIFESNQGQLPAQAQFVAREPGFTVLFERDRLQFVAGKKRQPVALIFSSAANHAIRGEKLLKGHSNYLIGNDPGKWHQHIPNYQAIRYEQLYPGVDVAFYGNGKHLEHDFIVAPGADPGRIQMQFQGEGTLMKGRHGEVWFQQGEGSLVFKRPVAYQETAAGRKIIRAEFVAKGNRLSFRVGRYNHSLPLVIDPILVYSTYLTGAGGATGYKIAIDSLGNAYIAGLVFATDFPTTAGSFQPACNNCVSGKPDVFVAKLNSTGSALVYATYLGGSDYDELFSLAVDGNGDVILGGRTQSTDFPTLPVETPTFNFGSQHGFVSSLTADGSALNWSHYSGGTNGSMEIVWGVATDSSNNVYVAGQTDNPDFPTTPGTIPHDPVSFQVSDIFAIKYNSSGVKQYSAVLGHNGPASNAFANLFSVGGIAVDSLGQAIIVGSATIGLPTTPGSFQPAPHSVPNSQNQNAFVVKLAADASAIVFGTYLGGSGGDTGSAVAVDSSDNIYLTGSVGAGDFPTTVGAFQTTFGNFLNCCGAFAAKFDPTGAQLLYSTFLGGTAASSAFTEGLSIAVDSGTGNAYVAGDTNDFSFPLLHPVQEFPPNSSLRTAFLSELDAAASHLLFSTVFSGSTGVDRISIALDANKAVYLGGTSFDQDLPTTPGAFQTSVAPPPPFTQIPAPFVAKIDPETAAPTACSSTLNINFPDTRVNFSSAPLPVTITNCGNANLTVNSVTIPPSAFQVQSNGCTTPVASAANCVFNIVFSPTQTGTTGSVLTISDNASIGTQKIALTGNGVLPQISFFTPIGFDPALVGTTLSNRSVQISNTGSITANISGVQLAGQDFAITSNNCIGALLPRQFCVIGLSFTPTSPGPLSGTVTIADDAIGNPHVIQLTGTGVASYPVPAITGITPSSAAVGTASFTLFVSGTNFFPASVIRINGVDHPTTYVSATGLQTTILPADLPALGEESVTVFNPAPGGGTSNAFSLTTFISIPLSASNIIYDPFTRKIYALLSGISAAPNSIVIVDPFTGQVGSPIPLGGSGSRQMALSDDGQFLYVGFDTDHTLGRLNLYTHQTGPNAQLGSDSITGATLTAFSIQPIPGDPHAVVTTVFRPASPGEAGIDLIRDGILKSRLPNDFPTFIEPDSLAFVGDPTKVYASGISTGAFYTFAIANDTLTLTSTANIPTNNTSLGSIVSDGVKLFTNNGSIIDPATATISGSFPDFISFTTFARAVIPATDIGRLFAMDLSGGVATFDTNTLAELGTLGFPHTNFANTMVRWGRDGFALLFGDVNNPLPTDGLLLFRTSLALPPPATAVAAISSLSPISSPATGLNFVLTVNGTGFAPGSVVLWNGAERTTRFVSATQLNADIPGTDIQGSGSAQVTVLNPGVGASSASTFTVTPGTAPFLQTSALSLDFGGIAVGGASNPQTLTISNTGSATLNITKVSFTGDFKSSSSCPTALSAGASCQLAITFNPAATGARSGVVSITDNAAGSPHQVALVGNGTDFQLAPGAGGPSQAIQSGQSAVYNLSLSGADGFSGSVVLGCSGAPSASTCNVTPPTLAIAGSTAAPFTVTVTTTARSSVTAIPRVQLPPAAWLFCVALVLLLCACVRLAGSARIRRMAWAAVSCGALLIAVAGCGGGSNGPTGPPVTGTPAGTYNVAVTATSNGATRTMQLTLVVR